MNLIRNTLIFIVILQLLGFLYFKTLHNKNASSTTKRVALNIPLPQSNDYTIYPKKETLLTQKPTEVSNTLKKDMVVKNTIPKKFVKKKVAKKKTIKRKTNKSKLTKVIYPKSKHHTKRKKHSTIYKKVETYAKKLLGYKYVWGATGPNTFDCSGFTQKVYRKSVGIKIPRVSRDQAKVGKYIEYEKLKKGDMVFFDTEKEYTQRVNHVGIYLGNQKFIHASSARKKVIITSFKKKPFYKRRFLWGRRVLKEKRNVNLASLMQQLHNEI